MSSILPTFSFHRGSGSAKGGIPDDQTNGQEVNPSNCHLLSLIPTSTRVAPSLPHPIPANNLVPVQDNDTYELTFPQFSLPSSFPLFYVPKHQSEYQAWQRKSVNYVIMFILLGLVGIPATTTRFNWHSIGTAHESLWFFAAQLSQFPLNLLICVYFGARLFLHYYPIHDNENNVGQAPARQIVVELSENGIFLQNSIQWILTKMGIENTLLFLSVVCLNGIFLGRIDEGACPNDTSVWQSQSCNPVANCHSFPHDTVILMFLSPLVVQIVWRGLSLKGVIFAHLVSVASISYAIYAVKGDKQMYSLLFMGLLIGLSLELERMMRISFVQHKQLEEAGEKRIAEINQQHQKDVRDLENKRRREQEYATTLSQKATAEEMVARVEAEMAVRLASDEAAEKERQMLRSVLGNVAHDMKTPLCSITGELDHLRKVLFLAFADPKKDPPVAATSSRKDARPPSDADRIAYSSMSNSAKLADESIDTIDSLLQFLLMNVNRSQDFVKASSNVALTPSYETVDICDALRFVEKCIKHTTNGRIIIIHPLPDNMCPFQITDHHYFVDNLLCLISNATKYSDPGSKIDVRLQFITSQADALITESATAYGLSTAAKSNPSSNCGVEISVADNGIGIPTEKKDFLFKAFAQTQRFAGGTGLGLYALKKRMDALGGTCYVLDRPDGQQGSVFCFTLPYVPDSEAAATQGRPGKDDEPAAAATGVVQKVIPAIPSLRVLLVDDTPSIIKMTKRFLEAEKHDVHVAENGLQCLNLLTKDRVSIDVLLTDLQMPVMDGIESARRYRAWEAEQMTINKNFPRLVIVAMSAKNDPETVKEVKAAGIDLFLPKPVKYKDFVSSLCSKDFRFTKRREAGGDENNGNIVDSGVDTKMSD